MLNSILLIFIIYFQCYESAVAANNFIPRIVNGKKVDIREVPYQIQLEFYGHLTCGGTIVTKKNVVSAAHCFLMSKNPSDLQIRAGTSTRDDGGTVYAIDTIATHPSFNADKLDYDAAVVTIKNQFEFSDTIQPIKMSNAQTLPVNEEGRVSGWGRTTFQGNPSDTLLNTFVPVLSHEECTNCYANVHIITKQMFCAGYPNGGYDACTGDSGGPFVINKQLFGIVSWGVGCAEPGYPGVYTSVPSVYDWLQQQLIADGDADVGGDIHVAGDIAVGGGVHVAGDVDVGGGGYVDGVGEVAADGYVYAGEVDVDGFLDVGGDVGGDVDGDVNVPGAVDVVQYLNFED